jgi:hypothetical protein
MHGAAKARSGKARFSRRHQKWWRRASHGNAMPGVAGQGWARSGKARYKAVHPIGCAAFSLKTLILTHKYKYEIIYFTAR